MAIHLVILNEAVMMVICHHCYTNLLISNPQVQTSPTECSWLAHHTLFTTLHTHTNYITRLTLFTTNLDIEESGEKRYSVPKIVLDGQLNCCH